MLRTLLRIERSFYADRQEVAPLLKEREAFLEHLLQQGTSLAAARGVSWQLLNVIRLLKLTELRGVWIDEIKEAAQRWDAATAHEFLRALLQALGKFLHLCSEEVAAIRWRAEAACDSAHEVLGSDR